MNIKISVAIFMFFSIACLAMADEVLLGGRGGPSIVVSTHQNKVLISENGNKKTEFEVESEKELHLETDDYDFDGFGDFSVWHIDEGMGTYSVYRVFIYDSSKHSFSEARPACGDEFINLKIDKKKKMLVSTFYDENTAKLCYTTLTAKQETSIMK